MTNIVKTGPPGASRPSHHQPASAAHRFLVALELMTAVTGITGGVLLIAAPDGSLLHAGMSALHGTPFSDWRGPGVLLLILVGGGFLLAGWWQWRDHGQARELSMAAGAGLIIFEIAEFAWIGFQPLQVFFALIGAVIIGLARRARC